MVVCSVCQEKFKNKKCVSEHLEQSNDCNEKYPLNPLVKWSGGKKDEISKFQKYIPDDIVSSKKDTTYIEPFIGGGALFFHLKPKKSVINDVHTELIDLYKCVKEGKTDKIYAFMKEHPNTEEEYYKVRSMTTPTSLDNAKRFYYLRKTCFRGMSRYNKSGGFNVPYGRYKTMNFEDLKEPGYQELLENTEVLSVDFSKIFEDYNNAKNFMFLDPPYDSEFTDYGYCSFGKEEHLKLAKCFKETKIRCLMVIGETNFIKNLYKDYIVDKYPKNYKFRLHSGRVSTEINTNHLVIKNF